MGPRKLLTTVVALGGGAFLLGAAALRLETQLTGVSGQGATGLLCLGVGTWNVRSAIRRPKAEPATAPA